MAHVVSEQKAECMAFGHAAGAAAALSMHEGVSPRAVNTDTLRDLLVKQGAILA